MKVYHGSYLEVRTIDLSLGLYSRDFGQGFYVTKIAELAQVWAMRKGKRHRTNGVVTEFAFNEYIWDDPEMKTLRFETYTESWLDFVVSNRLNRSQKQQHGYDMVEGPIADDDVALRVRDYINGKVSMLDFLEELKFNKPTHQICFCTTFSLQALEYADSRPEVDIEYVSRSVIMQLAADRQMNERTATEALFTSKTFTALADKTTELYLKPWQEIYEMLKKELA